MPITPNPPADFNPQRHPQIELTPFRFWCQKVLPLVYDDSLSYYELLCKVVDYLNKTMEDVSNMSEDIDKLYTAFNELQTYVNNYFDSLDVQEEINNKLDEMFSDGSFTQIFQNFYPIAYVKNYGAVGDGVTDDTKAIQECINSSCKIIMFEPNKEYKISKTLFIPVGKELDFMWSSLLPTGNEFTNNYVLSLNSSNVSTWDVEYSADIILIKRLRALNNEYNSQVNKLNLMFCATQFDVSNIISQYFNMTINTPSQYIDFKKLYNITIIDSFSNQAINIVGQGDGINFSNLHFIKYLEGSILSGLRLANCNGGNIKNLINGNHIFLACHALTLSDCHIERGSITTNHSTMTINDCWFYYNNDNVTQSVINLNNDNNSYKSYITLNNCFFNIYEPLTELDGDYFDINCSQNMSYITLNNCYRQFIPYTLPQSANSTCDCIINTRFGTKFLSNGTLYGGLLTNEKNITFSIASFGSTLASATISKFLRKKDLGFNGESGEYSYFISVILNNTKNIKYDFPSNVKSVTVNENSNMVALTFNIINFPILRIYRALNGTYSHYADIPNPSNILYDGGDEIQGVKWKPITGSVPTSQFNGYIYRYKEIQRTSTIYYSYIKTNTTPIGDFQEGDEWELNVPNTDNYRYIYDDSWLAV